MKKFLIPVAAVAFVGCQQKTPAEADNAKTPVAQAKSTEKPKEASAKSAGQPNLEIPAPADVAAPPADAKKTASGLAYKALTPATDSTKPVAADQVRVHYTGWTTDGKMFDSSVVRGSPATFPLQRVIAGWTEGLQLMTVGQKMRFWIPEALAYKGRKGAPAGMLVFDVHLQEVIAAPKAPAHVAGPPADAKKTATGLAYKVLKAGTGTEHPKATSVVSVHYSGWTTDGNLFDSSVVRGQPATFGLNRVIPGWTEGVQLMTLGEKTIFWIPEALAYKGRKGAPAGMLVFEVELLEIKAPAAPPKPAAAIPSTSDKKAN